MKKKGKGEVRKGFKPSDSESARLSLMWLTAKAGIKGNFIVLNADAGVKNKVN
jgi:hypothetical protein